MTDLEKLKELEAAVDRQLCDRNDLLGDDTLDDLFEVLGTLPALIAEHEAALDKIDALESELSHCRQRSPVKEQDE